MDGSLMGRIVYNKRSGLMGTVVAEDGLTLSIDTKGTIRGVTRGTFNRWFTVIDEDEQDETQDKVVQQVDEVDAEDGTKNRSSRYNPSGEKGVGPHLAEKFIQLVKDMANQHLDITYDDTGKRITIKYNNRNIFECSVASRRFNVFCHPNSLTAQNMRLAFKVFPKDWGWSLRAKFVFTSLDEAHIMKSIITDGMFYRQVKFG